MRDLLALLTGVSLFSFILTTVRLIEQRDVTKRWIRLTQKSAPPPQRKRFLFFAPSSRGLARGVPDVFELLALGLQAGQNFERAFELMVRVLPTGPLKREMEKSNELLVLGRSREEMMLDLKTRFHSDRFNGTFALILNSLRLGSPLQELLFSQAAHLRRERMREAERRAQTAGLRLLVPIMVFIFPTLFLLLFGSLYLNYIQTGQLF